VRQVGYLLELLRTTSWLVILVLH